MRARYLTLFSLSGLILALDQWSKHVVMSALQGQPSLEWIPGFLGVGYHRNPGFAFGFLQSAPETLKEVFFIAVPVFALILIVLIFIKLRDNQMANGVALSAILAGAVGNLVDRLKYGYVVDFVELRLGEWASLPPFNIADFAIVAGVVLMFYNTLKNRTPAFQQSQ